MISLIEKNKVNPSVASLKKVLDGIPLALADFFALEEPPDQKMFFSWDELLLLTEGKLELRQLGGRRPGQNLQILHERYEPGGDTSQSVAGADDVQAMLSHEGEEGGIVLKGQIELTVDGQTRVLGPGDAYFFKSRLPHRFRNTGDEACELISACTPPYI
jgi:mannose-6-phosphate isomerase-like protein (cupin superfamily)